MGSKWEFDKEHFATAIAQGEEQLKNPNLSRSKKQSIRYDIKKFKSFIAGDYDVSDDEYKVRPSKNIEKVRERTLKQMQHQYKILGPELITWLMELKESQIFINNQYAPTSQLSIDELAELTIKNYERNSKKFLVPAKKIILDDTVKQIQVAEVPSYTHHNDITGLSYIIFEEIDVPCIFNHEVQHAVERALEYPTHYLYTELGPHLMEMLFTEELYKHQGYINSGDFLSRYDDMQYSLQSLYEYFNAMLFFASKQFQVTTEEFLKAFTTDERIDFSHTEEYLKEENVPEEEYADMCYLFSCLKSIELREKAMNGNTDSTELLEPHLNARRFKFTIPQDGYKVYERYGEEMRQKVKQKK